MGKSKLKAALLRHQGRDLVREKQKKASRRQPKSLRKKGGGEGEDEDSEGSEAPELVDMSTLAAPEGRLKSALKKKTEEKPAAESDSEDEVEEKGQEEEEEDSGSASDAEEEEEEEEEDDIPLSDVSASNLDSDTDHIPYQKLTTNNTLALTSSLARISLPHTLPFTETLLITTPEPIAIPDIHDDLSRELAFYKQALSAATEGRERILKEGGRFSRPVDYFAEMLKDDEHMGKIRQKLLDEAAGKRAAVEARKQRDLKKFGKKVQVAKLQEREKGKREMLEKVKVLKRKRQGAETDATAEADMFDVALEDAVNDRRGRKNTRDGVNHKRQKKDQKYGFGGKKRFSKSTDAKSSGDLSSFSMKKNKAQFAGVKKRKPAMRPGKSKRTGGGGSGR
ncbi:Ebp2-domain-containing protein [Choiromyces venosus 120613-1]|uniref:Ebp2-domain-containing protein n=1 Tax=Choiromyces venosus 120613-1 TaxID=1336337 RepID=A0A3N4J296_9PEZI|nr:Ebp2-domain-containing protein [Choiromyces venosus 120613-1]